MQYHNRRVAVDACSFRLWLVAVALPVAFTASDGRCVTSTIVREGSADALAKGEKEAVVVGSDGTIRLSRAAETLVSSFEDAPGQNGRRVWSVNCVLAAAGEVYMGTSPDGCIYRYEEGRLELVYAAGEDSPRPEAEPGRACLANEHVFAMATDISGRLLAGVSGSKCELLRFKGGGYKTIFSPEQAKYIFAVALDRAGDIFVGTGPEGRIYRLDSLGRDPELLYDSREKNILSIAFGLDDGPVIYAGTDDRGLVYRIDGRSKRAAVLFDSDLPEITSLLPAAAGGLYAAATSANISQTPQQFPMKQPAAGKPQVDPGGGGESPGGDAVKLEIANTATKAGDAQEVPDLVKKAMEAAEQQAGPPKPQTPQQPSEASHVFRITSGGFATAVFTEPVVIFSMAPQRGELYIATANKGRLFAVDTETEIETVAYEDKQASQITAVSAGESALYVGTANPAKLIALGADYAPEGTYTSDLIDASGPAKWGRLQLDADVPQGCSVLARARSGNVKDKDDPAFSDWSEPVEVTSPVELDVPAGRFCQYELILRSTDGKATPVIREVAVAHTVPNLAPRVESVAAERLANKPGVFKVAYKATDANADRLIYTIDFRRADRRNWIELKDELEADFYEWDSRTVEDGRYELRVTASDERANTAATRLSHGRISDPVVVDNTPPAVEADSIEVSGRTATLALTVSDEFSAIGSVEFTVDSNDNWLLCLPDDLVGDTTVEHYTVVAEDLSPGEHVIAVKAADDVGNTRYRTFQVEVPD
jgi:hypothetical protein